MCFCVEQTHRELTESTFISDISVQYWRFYISKSWAYFIKLDQDLSLEKNLNRSKTCNITATCLKPRADAPLPDTKFQACSCNFAGFRAIRIFF